jgi:hypothetical protein
LNFALATLSECYPDDGEGLADRQPLGELVVRLGDAIDNIAKAIERLHILDQMDDDPHEREELWATIRTQVHDFEGLARIFAKYCTPQSPPDQVLSPAQLSQQRAG